MSVLLDDTWPSKLRQVSICGSINCYFHFSINQGSSTIYYKEQPLPPRTLFWPS